jgi:predicted TIM-barrel fold metal-dependent hydrolase
MPVVDADAHVVETDRTWDYMEPSERKYRPRPVSEGGEDFWIIQDRVFRRRRAVAAAAADTARASQEMEDLDARLRHMDALEVDVQVLYPSFFLNPITDRPEVEIALCKSYNRWLADICGPHARRLRWAATLPFLDIDESLREVQYAKAQGACAVFMRGIEGERLPSDPYFFPVYEELRRLDLPLCFHAATGSFSHWKLVSDNSFHAFKVPVVGAFHAVVINRLAERFPGLRFGFVEASAQWLPWLVHYLRRNVRLFDRELTDDLLREHRAYITCQTDDDLPYVLRYAGEDNLVIGTDYGHHDTSSEIEALRRIRREEMLPPAAIDKILWDNPRTLYGL